VPELSEKRKHESYGKEKQCIVAARKKSLPILDRWPLHWKKYD